MIIDMIDLSTFIGDLTQDAPPKSLMECYKEAGGFPFVAKVVAHLEGIDGIGKIFQVGDEIRLVRFTTSPGSTAIIDDFNYKVKSDIKRWTLVGHRT